MEMKRQLFTLLVGIDEYPIDHHRLEGCVQDRNAFREYLERHYKDRADIDFIPPRTLTNGEASREAVINAFDHFQAARDGDVCLFYFSGHGSRAPAPAEFWHIDRDKMNESIVCHDSRLQGGRDLMDKELSYLSWKVTQGKEIHFLMIFDCCHAGSNTRMVNARPRMAEPGHTPTLLQQYLGFEAYHHNEHEGRLEVTPPHGRHVQLAAARNDETAKELPIDGVTRGAFTYHLIEALEQQGGQVSYAELLHTVGLRIANRIPRQTPEIYAPHPDDKRATFLSGIAPDLANYYTIDYYRDHWRLNAGLLQGIPQAGGQLRLDVDGKNVRIGQVYQNYAQILDMEGRDTGQAYRASIEDLAFRPLQLWIAPDCEARPLIADLIDREYRTFLRLVEDVKKAEYWIRTPQNSLQLTLPEEERPLFRRVEGFDPESGRIFLTDAVSIARWRRLLELSNPHTSIARDALQIDLYRITEAGNELDNAPKEAVDRNEPAVFRYEKVNGQWQCPGFQLKITNTSERTFYISGLFLEANAAVSNRFLQKEKLEPGASVWMIDFFEGIRYRTIPLQMDERYHLWRITEITEYIKLLISTEADLSTDFYNQEGLELDVPEHYVAKRAGRSSRTHPAPPDWTTREIEMKIVRPMESQPLDSGRSIQLTEQYQLTAPEGFRAEVALESLPEMTRSVGALRPPDHLWGSQSETGMLAFSAGMGHSPGLSVLELRNAGGLETVHADQPLRLSGQPPAVDDEWTVALGLDPTSGLYYPLGLSDEAGQVAIESLPEASPDGARSLGGSIKIFFQKVVMRPLGYEYHYPQLAIAKFGDGNEFEYQTDPEQVRQRVGEARRILLFIHGIIGNTREMTQSIRRLHTLNGHGELADSFDLVLTFDYENLHTPIERTAALLRDKLTAAGLETGHGKHLTIAAHSMGGLVSRWFIEKEGGKEIVQHLIMLGAPNGGSPWSNVYELASLLLTRTINGAAFLKPYILPIKLLVKLSGQLFRTLEQMHTQKSAFLKNLNDGTDPACLSTIIAGNTNLIPGPEEEQLRGLLRKVLARFRHRPHYDLLDRLLFQQPNDIAVAVESITNIPGEQVRQFPPQELEAGCDHLSYFVEPAGLEQLAKALSRADNGG